MFHILQNLAINGSKLVYNNGWCMLKHEDNYTQILPLSQLLKSEVKITDNADRSLPIKAELEIFDDKVTVNIYNEVL